VTSRNFPLVKTEALASTGTLFYKTIYIDELVSAARGFYAAIIILKKGKNLEQVRLRAT
jgi:hypothetical protein